MQELDIRLPVTVRQAQKILSKALTSGLEVDRSFCIVIGCSPFSTLAQVKVVLDQMALKAGPNFVLDYEDYEGYDEDYEEYPGADEDCFGDNQEEGEQNSAGADSPSDRGSTGTAENRDGGEDSQEEGEQNSAGADSPSDSGSTGTAENRDGDSGAGSSDQRSAADGAASNGQQENPQEAQALSQPAGQPSGSADGQGDNPPKGTGNPCMNTRDGEASKSDCSETGESTSERGTEDESPAKPSQRPAGPASTDRAEAGTPWQGGRPSEQQADSLLLDPLRDAGTSLEEVFEADPKEGNQGQSGESLPDDVPTHQKKWGKKFSKAEKAPLSLDGNTNHGGITAQLGDKVDPSLLRLCRLRLAALVGDSSQNYSPRRDYAEFCARLKTYRNLSPARKEEEGRPSILLLADVSGSCSSFSEDAVRVAKAASRLGVAGADVVVVTHSNGYPNELEVNGRGVNVGSIKSDPQRDASWYQSLLARYPVTVVVALGDWDAARIYAWLVSQPQVERLIWLDNAYCTSRGTVKDYSANALATLAERCGVKPKQVKQKFIYRNGCKDAVAFVNQIKV